ncbi:MAG: RNA-directed DNA polymerase [Acidimicrobiia bacterium]|nr:RNA-directed DNA polymerase [Acidimicrobiia bacterium]
MLAIDIPTAIRKGQIIVKVQDASLEWAIKHVMRFGDTDVFPLPFEYGAIQEDWGDIKTFLKRQEIDTWGVREYRRMLTPKHRLGFRIATQLDPLDTLLICALVYEVGEEFESVRIPADQNIVHSYRFLPTADGLLYDSAVNFGTFRKQSIDLATEPSTSFVLMTDIADFFPRLYSHVVENAMISATKSPDHARVITKLINAWNMGVSYGIPVGPSPFRLIAELAINDIDSALLAENIRFCRYSDDYRIFAPNERSAREALAFLANTLFQSHGLTLQGSKTELIPADQFVDRFGRAERDQERYGLQKDYISLLKKLNLFNKYDPTSYDDLDDEARDAVDSLNLWELLRQEATSNRHLDVALVSFVLGRIRELGLKDEDNLLLRYLDRLSPAFREVVETLISQSHLSESDTAALGKKLIDLFQHDAVGYLDYHREWLIHAFTKDAAWGQTDQLIKLYQQHFDSPTQRAITLALGRAGSWHWIKPRKHGVFDLSPWNRRAFLYAASCLPGDESGHWFRFLGPRLDILERAVIKYAKKSPITS